MSTFTPYTNTQIWIPPRIDPSYPSKFAMELESSRRHEGTNPVRLNFQSNEGGESEAAMAITHLIKADGNIHGHLMGNAASAATLLFASCARRFVYPMTVMGFHIAYMDDFRGRIDVTILKALLEQFETGDKHYCEIYAGASKKTAEWWHDLLISNSYGTWLSAAQLVEIGMAELVSE